MSAIYTADQIEAAIAMTVDWLLETRPVVYTGRKGDQPLMADPHPLFQQCVKAKKGWWAVNHNYLPGGDKNGLAGVRAKQYTHLWRDHVLRQALRIYRSRSERIPLESVPSVEFALKPESEKRTDGTRGIRGIIGFEKVTGPFVESPVLPIDEEMTLVVLGTEEADLEAAKLDLEYVESLNSLLPGIANCNDPIQAIQDVVRGALAEKRSYLCGACRVPKRGHICPKRKTAPASGRGPTPTSGSVKRARK